MLKWPEESEDNRVFKREWIRVLTEEELSKAPSEHLLASEYGVTTVGEYRRLKRVDASVVSPTKNCY